jgi:AcrR family transcriptional regulator
MRMKDRTKAMFAEALEYLLKTKPLNKIRVLDLCRECGATPPTFYYHFHDKYDLVAWIYLRDIAGAFGDRKPDYSPERIGNSLKLMGKKRSFYQKVFAENSQNSIMKYCMDYVIQMVKDVMISTTGSEPSAEQMLEAKHHSYGIIGLLKEWIFGETTVEAEILARFYYEHTPGFLNEAFRKYYFQSDDILSNAGKKSGAK